MGYSAKGVLESPFGQALSFLTPFGGAVTPRPNALNCFPLVGALLGLVLGGLWLATDHLWPEQVAAAIVVLADVVLTGMLHLDGLADSADGLLGPLSKERRLEVMRDPRSGAFGVTAVGITLLLRWVSLSVLAPSIWLMVGIWSVSRTAMALVAIAAPYAREAEGGLASVFIREPGGGSEGNGPPRFARAKRLLMVGVPGGIVGVVAVIVWNPVAGPVCLVAGVVCALALLSFSLRRIGGYTGDVLGAIGVIVETVSLLVAAARW